MDAVEQFYISLSAAHVHPEKALAALHRLADQLIGARLFTITNFDPVTRLATRIYTNMPDVYPIGGSVPDDGSAWSQQVLDRHETFVANTPEDMSTVFPDISNIIAVGCGAVINVPVIILGRVVSTINCLDVAGHYTNERVTRADQLRLTGAMAYFITHEAAGKAVRS